MQIFEWTIALLVGAVVLNAIARRVRVPYPTFLALGGMALAFLPFGPRLTLDPDLALALFVAPVLLDAAYDASPRDLRRNVAPVAGLVFGAIFASTAAVALVAHALEPRMPWAVAIALGAMLAPPDAVAATAILRQIRVPRRVMVILEGESLLNDATALIIYRLAVGAVAVGSFDAEIVLPVFLLNFVGSVVAGMLLARLSIIVMSHVSDVAAATVLQFCGTFGVWILAEKLHLSGVLTIVAYASVLARRAPARTPARVRVPSYAVWDTAVFVLNVLAFMLIGLQLRPIVEGLSGAERFADIGFALAMLGTVVGVRLVFVLGFTTLVRLARRLLGLRRKPDAEATFAGALAIGWSGMRGIVTLAAAFALPVAGNGTADFPFRNLILLTAFTVVLGTLVLQGTTLRPLLAALAFNGQDPVQREVEHARSRVYRAALACLDGDTSSAADALRGDYYDSLLHSDDELSDDERPTGDLGALRMRSLAEGRRILLDLRRSNEIGDDAFHIVELELDRAQLNAEAGGGF